jgi:DNA helicase II / ATP-dependent DNA helicase PcrA
MALHLLSQLNREQAAAAAAVEGPSLVIAGAGSGKTRMITYRIAYMLEQGISPSQILALTFTNKAAEEMAGRIAEVTRRDLKELTASTFHAFGLSVIKRYGPLLGYEPGFTVYDQQDKRAMLRTVLAELHIDAQKTDLYALENAVSKRKSGSAGDDVRILSERIFQEYQTHLRLYNAVDFDDLIMLPLQLFSSHEEVLHALRSRFRYILVDEFQDTSLQQYHIVKELAAVHRNICVVGDDDQSIYSWRGADYRNIINFERDFPECRLIALEQNYRSAGSILSAANSLITRNSNRKEKRLWTSSTDSGSLVLTYPEDEQQEADYICDTIRELSQRERLRYDQFGILVRTNSLITTIERALLAGSVPYKVSGGESFFQRREIKDVISYLRAAANHHDDISILRILNTPRRGIGRVTLEHIKSAAAQNSCSLFKAMEMISQNPDPQLKPSVLAHISEFISLLSTYRKQLLGSGPLDAAVSAMVNEIGYRMHLAAEHPDNDALVTWKMRNIEIFISMIGDWEERSGQEEANLFGFLRSVSLKGKQEPDQEQGKVSLMTIHAAKGLEFHTVFLAGAEDHIIPHRRAVEEAAERVQEVIEEERRLFYVAITRAKQRLHITSSRMRKVMREQRESVPSRFLDELPKELITLGKAEAEVDAASASDYFARLRSRLSG